MTEHSLPQFTFNSLFIDDLMATTTSCFAMGYVEEKQSVSGFLILRPERPIPSSATQQGFSFGHSVVEIDSSPFLHFGFEFYGHSQYHALVNPGNPLVLSVLSKMIETQDYFFFILNPDRTVTPFRSHLESSDLVGLSTNLDRFRRISCMPAQYEQVCEAFVRDSLLPGQLLKWVCRDNKGYLDLTRQRVQLVQNR